MIAMMESYLKFILLMISNESLILDEDHMNSAFHL